MIYIVVPVCLIGIAILLVLSLFHPPIRSPLKKIRKIAERSGEITYVGKVPVFFENGLPYPERFEWDSSRTEYLDGPWKIRFDPEYAGVREEWFRTDVATTGDEWSACTVPSCFNTVAGENTDYEGWVWYATEFEYRIGSGLTRLCLDGALLRAGVWINGKKAGECESGFSPVYFDIGPYLQNGGNTVFIQTDNRLNEDSLPPIIRKIHSPGWHNYGGLFRRVFIRQLPEQYFVKLCIDSTPSAECCTIGIKTVLANMGSATPPMSIPFDLSLGSKLISGGTLEREAVVDELSVYSVSLQLDSPEFWELDNPVLYDLKLSAGDYSIEQKIGIRTVEVRDAQILLNGKQVFLQGICKHQDHPVEGACQSEKLLETDLNLIKELNAKYIRLAHYPHDHEELVKARDMGFLLSEEIPLYQAGIGFTAWFQEKQSLFKLPAKLFGLRHLYRSGILANAGRQLIRMIERDRNNPAVLFWSVGNECYTLGNRSGKVFRRLADTAREFDGERPVTYVEVTYDIEYLDKRKRGWNGMDICSLNSYYGWYYAAKENLADYLDRTLARNPGKPFILSEFGAGAHVGRTDEDGPWQSNRVKSGRTYSESYQTEILRHYWNEAGKRKRIIGFTPWVFADFYNEWFPDNPVPNYNLKGIVTADRRPKQSYSLLQKLYAGKD